MQHTTTCMCFHMFCWPFGDVCRYVYWLQWCYVLLGIKC